MINELKQRFLEHFNKDSDAVYFAPGRVNLIGEHIDYNGGLVFPCAIDLGTYGVVAKREDNKVRVASLNIEGETTFTIHDIDYKKEDGWANYPKGVIKILLENGYKVGGFDVLFKGNIPNSAGLSSSASLEVLVAVIACGLYDVEYDIIEIVKLCQKVENEFIGVNSGIMDQFAVATGKKNMAMVLNCDTLDYQYIPFDISGYKLIICFTNYKRGLVDSKYNERRSECERGLSQLQKELDIDYLCDMDTGTFLKYQHLIAEESIRRRVKHVVSENERVVKAQDALKSGNLIQFGKLMNESHDSLKADYEVTGFALDTMVEEARKLPGVIGSRMTGAGFGGCAIALVEEGQVDNFIEALSKRYKKRTELEGQFFAGMAGEGARKIC